MIKKIKVSEDNMKQWLNIKQYQITPPEISSLQDEIGEEQYEISEQHLLQKKSIRFKENSDEEEDFDIRANQENN